MVTQDAVRQHVATAVRKADLNTVSAKQIRRTVETQLSLSQGTLSTDKWKGLVKSVIDETIASIERGDPPPPSQKELAQSDSEEEAVPKKVKRKKSVIKDTPPSSPVKAKVKSPAKGVISDSPEKDSISKSPPRKKRKTTPVDSDSDMSVLNDATPPTSKPRKQKTKDVPTSSKSKSSTISKSTTKTDGSPTEEEIKHLKSLVFKCGVRKNWSKELPSTMSSSEQISHLKSLLSSLGMTSRLSVEKAKKIKEERELREELAFIQEGAKNVGEGQRRRHHIMETKPSF